jgi:hypothetical protein
MARLVIAVILTMVPVVGLVPGARAQIPQIPPLDDVTGPIQDTVDQVGDAVDQVGDAVDQTVGDAVETVEGTVSGVPAPDQVGSAATGAGGTDGGTAAGTLSGAGGGDAGGSSPGSESTRRRGSRARTDRSPSGRPNDAGGFRLARVMSAAGPASVMPLFYVPLMVRLTNDADGDGAYAESESAPRPGADIPFQLRLENAGPNELTILGIRDASSHPSGPSVVCGDLIGTRLATDQSVVCRFTVEGLAPTDGQRRVAVVEVDAAETADPSATGTITDTSVIRTEEVGVLGEVVRGVLGTLATTGTRIGLLAALAVGLAAAGVWMLRSGNRRREVRPWVRSGTAAGASGLRARTEGDERSPRPRRGGRHSIGSSLAGHATVRREGVAAGTARRGG